MSKLDGYAEEDKGIIKDVMCYAVEVQMDKGLIAESDEAIRAAMPSMFDAAKLSFDYLQGSLAGLVGYDAGGLRRLKTLSIMLFTGQIKEAKASITNEDMLAWMKTSISDARATVSAVDEYLAG